MKDFWKRKRNKRIAASALAVVMAGFLVWGLFPWQAAAAKTTVADDVTINKWHETLDNSTKNVGRIWTDKSVSTGNVTLSNKVGESAKESATIEKGSESDFLVGLSALSSTAKIMGQTTVPLDIVLVLDVSGSMDDPSGAYQEVYQLDTSKTYYILRSGEYTKVWYSKSKKSWYYYDDYERKYVTPKTSADDTDSNHDQFYSSRTKMEMLQDAVNGFIEQAANKNDELSDTNKQSRISLVKFAGKKPEKTDDVGNDTYEEGGYTYNYTQIVSGYKAYTTAEGESNRTELQNLVNKLEPAGATSADYAMELAKQLVSPKTPSNNNALNPRENAKKIVIFFTDGEPTSGNQFEDKVANGAIETAKRIKPDADIYTIGVFKDADASVTGHTGWGQWSDKERFNAYMHGMSSNYPDAEKYKKLGKRAQDSSGKDTQFYKAATDASKLNDIFKEIQEEIVTSAQSPTHVDQGELPNQSGYITFTDQLGDYMQVDDMNALVYANTIYNYKEKQESSDKSTITYIYEKQITDTNHVYPEGNLNDIKITVKKSDNLQTGDLVTVKIPANMIPLRYYEVSKGKMTISETYPMRLFYDVSLKAGAEKKIENPDAAMQAYIAANTNDEGQVQFYSNKYEAGTNDMPEKIGAYSHFVPATTNDFYYFQEDAPLYTDEECTTAATSIDPTGGTTYYYQRDYYELGEGGKADKQTNTVTIPGNSNTILEGYVEKKDGQYYIRAGAPRTTSLTYFTENKTDVANKTGTASTFIKPTWENNFHGKSVTTYLGNNGKMTFDLPGELDISKTVTAAEGHAVPDSLKNQEFEYKLELTAKEGVTPKGEYTAQKYTGTTATGNEFTIKSGETFTLKDRQTLKIYGLESGTTYTVTETKAAHFAGTAAQTNAGDNAVVDTADNGNVMATGAITGNQQTVVNYTNAYKADPVTLDGSANLKVKKEFQLADGTSAWDMEYLQDSQFTFLLTASGNTPMPEGYTEADGIKTAKLKVSDKNNITKVFGDITFTKPGTYEYQITEKDTDADRKLGVSYSYATYTVTVTVTDENGTLNAVAEMKKTRDDSGTELKPATAVAKKTAVFKNVYDADSKFVTIRAVKNFTDHTGSKTLEDGQYTFCITPKTAGAPLPEGDSQDTKTTNTAAGGVIFNGITFTAKDAQGATATKPKIYEYTLEEVLPEGANNYTVNGITYDSRKYTIQLKVYIEKVNGKDTVVVNRTYLNDDGTPISTEVPEFHNSYKADSVILTGDTALKGEKTLTGRDMLSGETFDFTLTAGDDSTKKALKDKVVTIAENGDRASVSGGTNGQAASFNFGNVTFTKEGRYTFDIKETVPDQMAGGVTYDQHTTKATVVVTDDTAHPGKLKASVTYNNGTVSDKTDKAVFENKYEASFAYSTTGGLLVEKVLNGRTMQAGEFNFTITPQDGAPGVSEADASFNNPQQRASGVPDSMQKLLGLTFTQNDAGKTYKYIVKETSGSVAGVTYDTTRFLVAIQVMDNGDGTMYAITTITPQNADGNQSGQPVTYNSSQSNEKPSLRFTNTYEAGAADPVDITTGFNKVLKGRSWNDNDSFTFTIANTQKPEGVEVAPMPNKTTVTVKKADVNAGKAPVDFGSITFAKAGVYKYTVTETAPEPAGAGMVYDTAPRTITVTVTDDGSGKLKAAVTSVEGSKTFTNEYKTADLPLDTACSVRVTKVLNGHDMAKDQFEFSIKAKDKDSAEKKLRIDENNGATFGSAAAADGEVVTLLDSLNMTLTQSDIGKTYSYTFAETKGNAAGYTYDENQYKLEITTHDAGDGTLTAIVVLTNTKTGTEVFNKTVSATDPALGEKGITIPFVNRYDGSTDVSGGTKATISADKTLNGRNLKDGEFTFTLATRPTTGNGTVLQTKTNNADGTIPFDALSYRTSVNAADNGVILSEAVQAGYAVKSTNNDGKTVYTLSYRVSETKGNLGGVSYTDTFFDFNVIVTDNGDGTLKAETQYPKEKNKFEFINTYSTGEPIPMDIKGSKTLNYAEGLTPDDIAGKFTFTLEAVTLGAPMPENTTAKNDAAGNVDFGNITFGLDLLKDVNPVADGSRSKTFEYKVTESGSAAGVTNDTDKTKTFKITLKDDGNGQLTATCDPKEGPKFTFTNTYSVGELPSSITDQIKIDKQLTGRDLKKGEFTFELLEDGDVVATGSNDTSGNVTFDKITYTQPGHHTYTVREVNNDLGGVTYDDQAYTVYTQIIDQGNGKLKAEHQAVVQMDNEFAPIEGNKITFTNKYEAKGTTASIGAVKRLTGKDLKDGQFTFQLKDENGKVIDEAKNDKAGAISFKALEFDKAGTYKYTISEVNDKQKEIKYDTSEKTVTITVKDSGDGYLQAQVESEKQLIFTNTFEAAGGSGTKTGDNMNLVLPIMMMLTAAAIGSVLLIRRKYHR